MKSEKVKEIKKALEACCKKNRGITILRGGEIKVIPYADILTYINELESENTQRQKLIDAYSEENERLYDDIHKKGMKGLEEQNEKNLILIDNLKDRIAELEKEIKKQLKQFAEKLKKEVVDKIKFYDACIDTTYNGLTKKNIDETLKEFL